MVNYISLIVAVLALVFVILTFIIWLFTGSTEGPVGAQGAQGAQGADGTLQGAQGHQGIPGPQGTDGNQGLTGVSAGGTTPIGVGVFNVTLDNNAGAITTINGNNDFHFTNYVNNMDVKINVIAGDMKIGQTCTLNFNFSANANFNIKSDNYYIALEGRFIKLNLNIRTNPVVALTYVKNQTIDAQGNPTTGSGIEVSVVIVSTGFPYLRS